MSRHASGGAQRLRRVIGCTHAIDDEVGERRIAADGAGMDDKATNVQASVPAKASGIIGLLRQWRFHMPRFRHKPNGSRC